MVVDEEVISGIFSKATKVFSGNHSTIVPTVTELWSSIDGIHLALLMSAVFASLLVLVLTIVQLRYLLKYTSNENLRSNMYFIISTPLITCGASIVGMGMPRSAAFLYGATVCYYTVVLFINVTLMQAMFGSRRALRKYMHDHGKQIKLAVKPYWCCCECLPQFPPTTNAFRVCEGLILQCVVLRIILQIMEICVFYELGSRNHVFFTVSQVLGLISMWVAFFMVYVLIDLGRERLEPYKYHILFRFTDFAQTLASIQKIGIDVLVAFELIPATTFFPAICAGTFYFNCLWCWEMLILSLAATYCFQPSKTLLFDKYSKGTLELDTIDDNQITPAGQELQEILLDKYEAQSLKKHREEKELNETTGKLNEQSKHKELRRTKSESQMDSKKKESEQVPLMSMKS